MTGTAAEGLGSQDEFLMWIGICITEWAHVDEVLFRVFAACVGNEKQCAILYYRINGLSTRFETVDEIVRSIFPNISNNKKKSKFSKEMENWRKLTSGFSDLLHVRRRIAHHPLQVEWQSESFTHPVGIAQIPVWKGYSYVIHENHTEQLRGRNATLPLRIADLQKHVEDVRNLTNRVRDFFLLVLKPHLEEPPGPNHTQL